MRFKPYAHDELMAADFHVHEPLIWAASGINGINAEHIQNCIFHFFHFLCVSRHIFALKINFAISLKEFSFYGTFGTGIQRMHCC